MDVARGHEAYVAAEERSWAPRATEIPRSIPPSFHDRGLFTRTFDAELFDAWLGAPGTSASFIQDSQSRSGRGVIRGLHGRGGRGEGDGRARQSRRTEPGD